MAITSQISLRGFFTGLLSGSRSIAPGDQGTSDAPSQVTQVILQSGANTIIVPSKARGVIIVFDNAATSIKTLKGITGDTGIEIGINGWVVLPFDSTPPASFVITSNALDTVLTEITFF